MEKNENREEKNKGKNLASRLNERSKRETTSGIETKRLGNRLTKRIEELGEKRKKKKKSLEEETEEVSDFFEEITNLAKKHPELKNVKVSELKKAISQTGMRHPEEVIDKLRKKEYKTKLREMDDEWITH